MKIIFRYLTFSLIKAFIFCCFAMLFLWLIVDLFGTLGDLVKQKAGVLFMLKFYMLQLPFSAQMVLPVAFLVSSLFVLTNFSQSRELVALQAAGISLGRIGIPFFALAIFVSAVQYALFWDLTPTAEIRRDKMEKDLGGVQNPEDIFYSVLYREPKTGIMWYVQEVNVTRKTLKQAEMVVPNSIGGDAYKLFATGGTFQNGIWELNGVRKVEYSLTGAAADPVDYDHLSVIELTTPPHKLVEVLRPPQAMSWGELASFIRSSRESSPNRMAPYFVEHYYRQAYPFMPVILCLFGLALGSVHSRRNVTASVFNCVFILAIFYVWFYLSMALGNGSRIPPFIAVWNAVLVFGLGGIALFGIRCGWFWELQDSLRRK